MRMKYAIEQRLRFIDFLVSVYGYINRNTIVEYFGISVPQVSNDFKTYIKMAPNNIIYNNSLKRYDKTDKFKSLYK